MKTIWSKIKWAVREFFNFLTNLLCPIMAALCVLAELLQLPASVIQVLKKVEYWGWKVSGTKEIIDEFVEKVDDAVEKTEEEQKKIEE